jgi:hypothetical protein
MAEWPKKHVADIGPLKLHSVFNWVEEDGVDLEREADDSVGHDDEAFHRERQRLGRLRLEELDVGAQARHGRIRELLRVGDSGSRSGKMCRVALVYRMGSVVEREKD